jgi:membrane protease YdiL (CAAX protease family)
MTAIAARAMPVEGLRAAALLAGLATVVGLRWAATVSGLGDALTIGLAFGVGLLGIAMLGGQRLERPAAISVPIGLVGGAVLVALALLARAQTPGPSLAPAAAFLPWASITVVVATAEELILRGVLFGAIRRQWGLGVAVAITTVAFALMHVPLYGWHVVPLDIGVGIWLAGLRLLNRGVAAPAIAHTVADLATWWL